MRTWLLAATVAAALVCARDAAAFNQDGQWDYVPEHIRNWFKSVRSPSGVPCCDISDGHPTEEDARADGLNWIPHPLNPQVWVPVPPEAIVYNAGNPIGQAVVWYVRQGDGIFIRCFVPGARV